MNLTIIIPTYNSANHITQTLTHVCQELSLKKFESEIVLVDNASSDNTLEVCKKFTPPSNICINIFSLPKNYGQKLAIILGLNAAAGPIAVSFDDDLQFNFNDVFKAIEILEDDYNIIMVNAKAAVQKKSRFSIFTQIFFNHYYRKSYFTPFKVYRLSERNLKNIFNPFFFWKFKPEQLCTFETIKKLGIRKHSNYSLRKQLILASTVLYKTLEKTSLLILSIGVLIFVFNGKLAMLFIAFFLLSLSRILIKIEKNHTAKIIRDTLGG